jgi:drug/metabolite transporter (DMT)-like permease
MGTSSLLLPSLAVAGSGLLWGIWWIPLRWLEGSGLSGDWAGAAVYAAAAAVLAPFVLLRRSRLKSGGWDLLLTGLFSGLAFTTWNHALITGDVVRVTLLFYLSPIWGTGLGFLFFRDPVRPLRVLSILSGLAGAAVVLGFDGGAPLPRSAAEWVALGSGVLFAFAAICSRRAPQAGGLDKTFLNSLFAGVGAVVLAISLPGAPGRLEPSIGESALPIVVCLIWQIPVTWALLWGAARLDAGRVGILLLIEVMAAAVSAAILTDEPFGWREAVGCVLIVTAGLIEGLDEMQARAARRRRPA